MQQSQKTAVTVQRNWRLISGVVSLVLGAVLGLIVLVRGNTPLDADLEWMEEIAENRNPAFEVASFVLDMVGAAWASSVIAIAIGVVLIVLRRPWTAMYFVAAIVVSTLVVQVLKTAFGRLRPEDIMLTIDSGSFPSGHVANAATLAATLAIITWRWWVLAAGAAYVVLMALSRTYLGAHWVSDTVGGLLLGAGVAIIVWAPFAYRLLAERRGQRVVEPLPSEHD